MVLGICFFAIAFIYSAIGFGGGSSYTALLTFFDVDYQIIPLISLSSNLVVVIFSSWKFHHLKITPYKKALPLIVSSIPMAFLGGIWEIKKEDFLILLGCSLIVAAVLMFLKSFLKHQFNMKHPRKYSMVIGGLLGFLSGLVGIGGGIYLSPLLFIVNWDQAKKIAATASLFILVNSLSGLIGQLLKTSGQTFLEPPIQYLTLPIMVLLGGLLGNTLITRYFNDKIISHLTALLVLIAGIRLVFQATT